MNQKRKRGENDDEGERMYGKIQNRERVRSHHFEPLIRDGRAVEGEKQEAVTSTADVAASKRNDEFLAIFVCRQELYCLGNNPDHAIGTR